jgi:hypothetical protein
LITKEAVDEHKGWNKWRGARHAEVKVRGMTMRFPGVNGVGLRVFDGFAAPQNLTFRRFSLAVKNYCDISIQKH